MLPVRLQKFIADSGLMSRRAAEEEIKLGNVAVNGHVAELGSKINPHEDIVTYKGKRIRFEKREYTYIMLNKPKGYVCTTNDELGRKTVMELLKDKYPGKRIFPVGRLDYDTEGLLLLTTDGDLANRLMHPRNEISKTYGIEGTWTIAGKNVDGSVANYKVSLSYGKEKHRFYNPVLQNKYHISQLQRILKEKVPFYSVIVFYGNCRLEDISFIL